MDKNSNAGITRTTLIQRHVTVESMHYLDNSEVADANRTSVTVYVTVQV